MPKRFGRNVGPFWQKVRSAKNVTIIFVQIFTQNSGFLLTYSKCSICSNVLCVLCSMCSNVLCVLCSMCSNVLDVLMFYEYTVVLCLNVLCIKCIF